MSDQTGHNRRLLDRIEHAFRMRADAEFAPSLNAPSNPRGEDAR